MARWSLSSADRCPSRATNLYAKPGTPQYTCLTRSGELFESFAHRCHTRLHVGQLGFDTNAVRTGEPIVAFALHELQHFDGLDRRIRDELQLNGRVARIDTRDAQAFTEHTQAVTIDQRARLFR